LIAGRKLLLADDSIAIQKVIDLTFTDEGMEVTAVGDGQDALEKLNQLTPDVVLADVYMPGVDGYELCRFIKENERFRDVPVMLLVGSFEPFDEAAAKRAGADDVVTKPFQSIRDLVSRVGSLVRHGNTATQNADNGSTVLGLSHTEENDEAEANESPSVDFATAEQSLAEPPNVRVFVEAPTMQPDATVFVEAPMDVEPPAAAEHEFPPVIDLQIADTKKLEPIADSPIPQSVELSVVDEEVTDQSPQQPVSLVAAEVDHSAATSRFDEDGVLDLGDIDSFAAESEDDFVLDLDVEPVGTSSAAEPEMMLAEIKAPAAESPELNPVQEPVTAAQSDRDLSPDAIDAISRRVVEQLSDKVVREIAWEVVPELSELLIKRRLEEQR
jgi:CheY-like chemotaxis protein